ncbi:hypothetical protein [Streptomyces javensis]|uniref:Scaffolding protein n=1 Tax=Streptomyces javensis TaxID=114698 RepID=A0ABS0R6M0_9ACTN|nr:hypothetical protein [Streptomyces javensis]MBI0313026.1 hypothetical protein [Streptomyces javensis]
MHRSTPRPRPVPGAIVGYVGGRPVRVIAGGSGEADPPIPPNPNPDPPAAPPVPTPKDVADRQGGLGDEETVTVTQKRLNLMMTREKDQGRQAALRDLAKEAGLDPDSIDADQLRQVLADAKKLKDAQLSEEQRREAAFDEREKAVSAKETAAAESLATAQAKLQEAQRTAALLSLGAADEDLEDALVLLDKALKDTPDADADAIAEAAKGLKKRRPALFGTAPALKPPTPPAPSGSPAGGPPQRQAPTGKPGDAGRAMAARMFGTGKAAA